MFQIMQKSSLVASTTLWTYVRGQFKISKTPVSNPVYVPKEERI